MGVMYVSGSEVSLNVHLGFRHKRQVWPLLKMLFLANSLTRNKRLEVKEYHIFGGKSKRNLRLLSYGVNALLTPRTKTGITSWLKETGLETIDCLRGGLRLYFTTLLSTSKQKISQ